MKSQYLAVAKTGRMIPTNAAAMNSQNTASIHHRQRQRQGGLGIGLPYSSVGFFSVIVASG